MTQQLPATADRGVALDDHDARRVVNAIARLPFAADTRVKAPRYRNLRGSVEQVTTDAIVEFLDTLAPVLREYVERAHAVEAERDELLRDRAAVRRFLGTD